MKKHGFGFYKKFGAVVIFLFLLTSSVSSLTMQYGTNSSGTSFAYGGQELIRTSKNSTLFALTESGLQSAINGMGDGGTIHIPECNISVTNPLNISIDNISLVGTGRNSILSTSSDINILELYGPAAFPNDLRGVVVSGLLFKGDASHTSKAGITLGRGHHIKIENCFFSNLYDGMYIGLYDDTDNSWFCNNHLQAISHYGMFFSARTQENVITGNTMEPGTTCDAGIYMQGQNNVISGNTVEEVGVGSGLGDGMYCGGMENVVIGNTFRACGRHGIYLTWNTGVGNNTVTGNYIENANNQGIYVKGQNHIITNNMLNNNGVNAIHIDDEVGGTGRGILVANNHIGGFVSNAIVDDTGNATLSSNYYNQDFNFLTVNDTASIDVNGELWFNSSGSQMFEFSKVGTFSYLRGSQSGTDSIRIQPVVDRPYIDLIGGSDIRFYKDGTDGDLFRFYEDTNQFLTLDRNDSSAEFVSVGGDVWINSSAGNNVYVQPGTLSLIRNSNGKCWSASESNLQSAIWDLNSTLGGTVYLPEGNISLTSSIFLDYCDNVTLMGAGVKSTNLVAGVGFNDEMIEIYYTGNVTIMDMTLDMVDLGSNCIRLKDSKDIRILNVEILNPGGQGIYGTSDKGYGGYCERIYIDNFLVSDPRGATGHAIAFKNVSGIEISNTILIANNIGGSSPDGMDFSQCKDVNINNVEIQGFYNSFKIAGASKYPCANITISNLKIDSSGSTSIELQEAEHININNFEIMGSGGEAINTGTTTSYVNVQNGHILNPTGGGLNIRASHSTWSNIICRNSGDDDIAIYSTINNVTVTNCEFINGADACRIENAENIIFMGNKILENKEPDFGSLYLNNNHGIIVTDSIIKNCAGRGIYFINTHNISITGNIIKNNNVNAVYIHATGTDFYIVKNNIVGGHTAEISDNGAGTKDVASNLGA